MFKSSLGRQSIYARLHGEMSRQRTLISLWSSQPAPSDVAPHTGTVADKDTPIKRGRSIEELQHEYESQFSIFKRKRAVYNHEEKMAVCSVLQACEHNCNKAHAMLTKSGVQMGYKSLSQSGASMNKSKMLAMQAAHAADLLITISASH